MAAATMKHTTLSAAGSIATLPEPSWCLAGHQDGRASSVLPPRGAWTIGPHNHTPHLTPYKPLVHALTNPGPSRPGGQAQPDPPTHLIDQALLP